MTKLALFRLKNISQTPWAKDVFSQFAPKELQERSSVELVADYPNVRSAFKIFST